MKKIVTTIAAIVAVSTAMNGQDIYAEWRASWLRKAEEAKPSLTETVCRPVGLMASMADADAWQEWRMEPSEEMNALYDVSFKAKQSVIVDFGRHLTGHFTFHLKTISHAQDAPIRIKFTFAEVPAELNTPFDPYPGSLSRAWLQDEVMTIMTIDRDFTIPRRLSGRYMKIELLAGSAGFDFALSDIYFTSTTSASDSVAATFSPDISPVIRRIGEVSIETLRECMQTVYEDGPKRDQRLWIGDMYLEALANTYSFGQHGLTRRCLYLLAALAAEDGRLHANVFERPEPHPQYGTLSMDYSLIYNVALLEYLKTTGDRATALDLWPVVKAQVADAMSYLDDNYIFDPSRGAPTWLVFDWRAGLDTHTMMQGCMIWALKNSYELAEMLGKTGEASEWPKIAAKMSKAARKYQFDARRGIFLSGPQGQVSCLSQAWMILAEVVTPARGARALQTVFDMPETVYPGAPYAYHYLIEALVKSGLHSEANRRLVEYWGGMVERGADTFWEVYDPQNPSLSPYNFFPVNSYCHAWSCTPIYFIHRYPDIFR
jgi:hypothetical protein